MRCGVAPAPAPTPAPTTVSGMSTTTGSYKGEHDGPQPQSITGHYELDEFIGYGRCAVPAAWPIADGPARR